MAPQSDKMLIDQSLHPLMQRTEPSEELLRLTAPQHHIGLHTELRMPTAQTKMEDNFLLADYDLSISPYPQDRSAYLPDGEIEQDAFAEAFTGTSFIQQPSPEECIELHPSLMGSSNQFAGAAKSAVDAIEILPVTDIFPEELGESLLLDDSITVAHSHEATQVPELSVDMREVCCQIAVEAAMQCGCSTDGIRCLSQRTKIDVIEVRDHFPFKVFHVCADMFLQPLEILQYRSFPFMYDISQYKARICDYNPRKQYRINRFDPREGHFVDLRKCWIQRPLGKKIEHILRAGSGESRTLGQH